MSWNTTSSRSSTTTSSTAAVQYALTKAQVYITATASAITAKVAYPGYWDELDRLCAAPTSSSSMWGTPSSEARPWKRDTKQRESVARVLEKLSFDNGDATNSTAGSSSSARGATATTVVTPESPHQRIDLQNEPTVKRLMETLHQFNNQDNNSDAGSAASPKTEKNTEFVTSSSYADDQAFTQERLRLQRLAKEALEERMRRIHDKPVTAAELFELEIQRAEEEEARRQAELDAMTPAERELAEGKRRAQEAMARLKAEQRALQEQQELAGLDGEEYAYNKEEPASSSREEEEEHDTTSYEAAAAQHPPAVVENHDYNIHSRASLEVVDEVGDSFDDSAEENWEELQPERDEEEEEEEASFKTSNCVPTEEEASQKQETASTSDETEQGVSVGPHVGVDQSEATSPLTMKGALSPESTRPLMRTSDNAIPALSTPSLAGRHLSFDQISLCGSDTVSNFSSDSGSHMMQKKKKKKISDLICRDLVGNDPLLIAGALSTLAAKAMDASDRASIVRFGGILAIVQTMERHTEKAAIQVAACLALERLALDTENELAIGEVKGVEAILGAMMAHFTDAQVQEAAWSALCNCACGNACETMTIDTQGGMAALVSCMKQHVNNPKVVASAMNTFTNLCLNNDTRMQALATSDGFGAIATALQRHWTTPSIRNEASYTMNVLLQKNASVHAKLIAGDGDVEHEEEIIEDEEESVEEYIIEEVDDEYEDEIIDM